MSPKLKDSFTEEQADAVRACVQQALLPYRMRFWGAMIAVTLGVILTIGGFTTTQSNVAKQANLNTCKIYALVYRATPLRPRPIVAHGHLRYTQTEIKQILDMRRNLLVGQETISVSECRKLLPKAFEGIK